MPLAQPVRPGTPGEYALLPTAAVTAKSASWTSPLPRQSRWPAWPRSTRSAPSRDRSFWSPAPPVRVVTRWRRSSPPPAAQWWRPAGASMRCVTSPDPHLGYRASHARDPGERGRAAAARHAANRATFAAEVMTHTVAPEAISFLASDAAAPVSGAILPAY